MVGSMASRIEPWWFFAAKVCWPLGTFKIISMARGAILVIDALSKLNLCHVFQIDQMICPGLIYAKSENEHNNDQYGYGGQEPHGLIIGRRVRLPQC